MPETQQIPLSQAKPPVYLGIDIGGTRIKMGLVDDLGRTVAFITFATHAEDGPEQAIQRIVSEARSLAAEIELDFDSIPYIGLATPGPQDIHTGIILYPANLPGWMNCPIRNMLQRATGLPVAYQNDANAAAFGESWIGSARDYESSILITLGTGVGCGIIIGDAVLTGDHSHGGECGHIIVDTSDDAMMCGCGQPGHLEAYASATALAKWTQIELDKGIETTLNARIAAGEELSPLMLFEEAEKEDQFSLDIIMKIAHWLGIGIVTLMHTLDPAIVIIGGAMTFGGDEKETGRRFMAQIQTEIKRRTFRVLAEQTIFTFAKLGNKAGYIGAAGIARVANRARLNP